MKYFKLVLFPVILAGILAVSRAEIPDGESNGPPFKKPKEAADSPKGGFSITVDPRIELLAVVQHFTSWSMKGHIKSETAYKKDIDDYFGKYSGHEAVAFAESLVGAGFAYDAPVQMMLNHADPPELELTSPYSDYLVRRARGEDVLSGFAASLRNFALRSEFMAFFKNHAELYDTLTLEAADLFEGKDYVKALEEFYGTEMNSYNLIFAPLFSGNYGIPIESEQGWDLFAVIGPCTLKVERTTFACLAYLENMVLHEWSHSFVNHLVDENYDRFKKSSHLFKPISLMMRRQAYPNWRVALYEHLVRACGEVRVRRRLHQDFDMEKTIRYHEGKGFWYMSFLDSILDDYENNRGRYVDFSSFVPVIAESLTRLSAEDLPDRIKLFRGPMDAVFNRTDRIYLVYPSEVAPEPKDALLNDLRGFARFLTSARIEPLIISDKEALELDWSDKVAFIYGNSGNNIFFSDLDMAIPLCFKEGGMEFCGKDYRGEGVFLLSCMPNPYNPDLPFCVCAANDPSDLVGLGARITGPEEWYADYILYRGGRKISAGTYRKESGRWTVTEDSDS